MLFPASLLILVVVLGIAAGAVARRRAELRSFAAVAGEVAAARTRGSHKARLQHPVIDRTQCIGCGACVAACPEEGVLAVVYGQAAVVHGAQCVGHARCEAVCPTGAIRVTIADLGDRRDLPALTETLEAKGRRGVYLAGEITGYALVRTAIAHGVSVADEVAARVASRSRGDAGTGRTDGVLDLLVVGAGPAGIACGLRAKERGLSFRMIEQEQLGGTVAKYPRRKLVMTQPVTLPLHGPLPRTTYGKEELLALWEEVVARHDLPLETGVAFEGMTPDGDGAYTVRTSSGTVRAANVVLAIGRRGRPRKLGVPGEELPKVAYHLIDAQAYGGRRVLVVGGGDSAVEAALGLAAQEGTEVVLSYRRPAFFRLRSRNESNLAEAVRQGRVRTLLSSEVREIGTDFVKLSVGTEDGGAEERRLANDDVFVLAGGVPPFAMLESAGISFDPADRDPVAAPTERGTGLFAGLAAAFGFGLLALGFVGMHARYYLARAADRPFLPLHDALRPGGGIGLAFALLAATGLLFNVTYLVRRTRLGRLLPGSLRRWMTLHLATGLFALMAVGLHAGLAPRDAVGGHAWLVMGVVVAAGAFGRYLYALVPRATTGREMEIEEVRVRLAALSGTWDGTGSRFADRARVEVEALVSQQPWRRSFPRRLLSLLTGQRRLARSLVRLRAAARREGLAPDQTERLVALARGAHRAAVGASHYEDVRAVLSTWRYLHRWLALLLLLLVALHVTTALRYADLSFDRVPVVRWFVGGAGS